MKLFVSPPFGNFSTVVNLLRTSRADVVPIIGSFTVNPRPGRWSQVSRTLRYDFSEKGWTNSIGLRNQGLSEGLDLYYKLSEKGRTVMSFAPLGPDDLEFARAIIPDDVSIEINVSCPNVPGVTAGQLADLGASGLQSPNREFCIVKLPYYSTVREVRRLHDCGITQFHCSNTNRGLSGPSLLSRNLSTIQELDRVFCGNLELIGGGGVADKETIDRYMWHGADHVSISSVCFNPLATYRLIADLRRDND